jgi:hypothetical protein
VRNTPQDSLFHHNQPVAAITDINPRMRDNSDLIGMARGVPVNQDGPSKLPQTHFQRSLTT